MKKITEFEKIMQVLNALDVKQTEAELKIGASNGIIGKLPTRKNGHGKLSKTYRENFLRTFQVNPNWWKTGEGEMFLPQVKVVMDSPTNKPDPLIVFAETLTRLMEKNDSLLDQNVKLVDQKNGEINHLRSNETWYQRLVDELRTEARLSKGAKQ